MRHTLKTLVRLSIVGFVLIPWTAFAAAAKPAGESAPGEVIVKFRPGTPASAVSAAHQGVDIDSDDKLTEVTSGTIRRLHSRSKNTEALIKALEHNPNVVYVEPNYIMTASASPNDPEYTKQWGLRNVGGTSGYPYGTLYGAAGADIDAEAAWNVTTGSPAVVVAIVDSGIDYNHPDLAANIWSNPGGVGDPGCAAGTHGFDVFEGDCDPISINGESHATLVAGVIGAVGNNGTGIAGTNWTASLLPIRALAGTTISIADAIEAFDLAVRAKLDGVNVRVLNASWGSNYYSLALLDEILKANEHDILIVAAAGNSGSDNDIYPVYPASYAAPNVISVMSTDTLDRRDGTYASNWGPNSVHLGAPGNNIYSCVQGGSYGWANGTSMAAAHVSGAAALVLANAPSLTAAQVKAAILNGVDEIAELSYSTITGGRLNVARAIGAPPGPRFSISANPTSIKTLRGETISLEISILPTGGFTSAVELSAGNLPAGATATFAPVSTTDTATLSITTQPSSALGTAYVTINGTSGSQGASTTVALETVATLAVPPCSGFRRYAGGYAAPGVSTAASGDFDRDGIADFVVAAPGTNRLALLRGTGLGLLAPTVQLPAPGAPVAVAIADFDRDGHEDLATADSSANGISIRLGVGDGSFLPATSFGAGASPFSIAAHDFDRDGAVDLAVANNGGGSVSILMGAGDGSFAPAVNFPVGSGPFHLAAGDLNRDGNSDIVVAVKNSHAVDVLLGIGDGSFLPATAYAAGTGTSSVAIGDFNRDGVPDVAASGFSSNDVSVMLGVGDGTLHPAVSHPVHSAPYAAVVIDADDDGNSDIAVVNSMSNDLSILRGRGDGTFEPAQHISSYYSADFSGPSHLIAGRFDGDARTDLAVLNANTNYLMLFLNTGACVRNCGALGEAGGESTGVAPNGVVTRDFDRDGIHDLAVANSGDDTVTISSGNGDGTFQPAIAYATGDTPRAVGAQDFDGDGVIDLAVANRGSNDVSVLLGKPDGSFHPAVNYGCGVQPEAVAIGDVNRDGVVDLAVANEGSGNVSVLLGDGLGGFAGASQHPAGTSPRALALQDVDGDARLDMIVANSGSDDVSILRGNGDGTFAPASTFSAGSEPSSIVAVDLDRNGAIDLAISNAASNDVSILRGGGDGSFASAVSYPSGSGPSAVVAGDFNLDGTVDLAIANSSTNGVALLSGLGDLTFGSPVVRPTGQGPAALVADDFNRDGRLDVVTADSGANALTVLLNSCPVPDLTAGMLHGPGFSQGATGRTFTITVSNAGGSPSQGLVSLTGTLPEGLIATGMAGAGWTCSVAALSCMRQDALATGASYPPVTLTADVANTAPPNMTATATVAGGSELNPLNNVASSVVAIDQVPDLVLSMTRVGAFAQGETGQRYRIVVRNPGGAAAGGTITVTDTLPSGLTASAISGPGWNCTLGSLSCSRGDGVATGAAFPTITVTVDVAPDAPAEVVNVATAVGTGETSTENNTARDRTIISNRESCNSHRNPVEFLTGREALDVEIADLDLDGIADIAIANYQGGLTILMGTGAGEFGPAVTLFTNRRFASIESAYMDGDDVLDIAASDSDNRAVSILRGLGNGTFELLTTTSTGVLEYPGTLRLADFNEDGHYDVAVTSAHSWGTVKIFLGNGNGSLRSPSTVTMGQNLLDGLETGNIDGDGHIDLIVADGLANAILVLRGNGDGTFQSHDSYPVDSGPRALAIGDLNEDGIDDVSVAHGSSTRVAVLPGRNDGTLGPVSYYSGGVGYPPSLVLADLDGNGSLDLATPGYLAIHTLLGNGDGTFQPSASRTLSFNPPLLYAGDFNLDGKADLIAFRYDSFIVMLGDCPDLGITKSHTGDFSPGQTGAEYSIVVSNGGAGASAGSVTVADTLPFGLLPSYISGTGWTCTQASVSCSRSDALAPGASFPAVKVIVNVSSGAPASVTNVASVSGGGERNLSNNGASDPTTVKRQIDLTIAKSHSQAFAQGGIGFSYTIVVTNGGSSSTTAPVTVLDSLPATLTATSMQGPGWSCNLSLKSCTRSDALGPSQSFPPITLTVNVAPDCPAWITNYVTVSGGGDTVTSNNVATDDTMVLTGVTSFEATTIDSTSVKLSWTWSSGAADFLVYEARGNGSFTLLGVAGYSQYTIGGLTPNTVFRFRIQPRNGSTLGPMSFSDSAVTMVFTDDPVVAQSTIVKAVHFQELRTGVNLMRAAAGLAPATFTDPVLTSTPIKSVHYWELWERLNEARVALGVVLLTYSDYPMQPGKPITATQIAQLRYALK